MRVKNQTIPGARSWKKKRQKMRGKQIKIHLIIFFLWFPFISTPLYSYRGFIVHKFSFACVPIWPTVPLERNKQSFVFIRMALYKKNIRKMAFIEEFAMRMKLQKCWHDASKTLAPLNILLLKIPCNLFMFWKITPSISNVSGFSMLLKIIWAYWLTVQCTCSLM